VRSFAEDSAAYRRDPWRLAWVAGSRFGPDWRRRLDFGVLGRFGKQPAGEILPADESREKAAGSGNREMGTDFASDCAGFGSVGGNMPLLAKTRSFLRNILSFGFSSGRRDGDLDQEIRSHLEMLVDENVRAGMAQVEARRAALIELGGAEQVKEQVREVRIGNWLRSVGTDCRYGARQLRKHPGFAVVAIATLATAIG